MKSFLNIHQVNYLLVVIVIMYGNVQCQQKPPQRPNLPRLSATFLGKVYFLPDASGPLGMFNGQPGLIFTLNNTGSNPIPASALKLYVTNERKENVIGLKEVASVVTKEIPAGKHSNISEFSSKVLQAADVPKSCKPKIVIVTFVLKDTTGKLIEHIIKQNLVHIGGKCKPPVDNVKVHATLGTVELGSDSDGEFLDLQKLLSRVGASLDKGSTLQKRLADENGNFFKYPFLAFFRKHTEKSMMYFKKFCPNSKLIGSPNLQLDDVVLQGVSKEEVVGKFEQQLMGKLYLSGSKSNVCPFSICGKGQIIFMFDHMHMFDMYKEAGFDVNKCDNIIALNVSIDCKNIADKLDKVQHVEVVPDIMEQGISSYMISCNGRNPPKLATFSDYENAWTVPCFYKFEKSMSSRLARLRLMAINKVKELKSKTAGEITTACENALKNGKKGGGNLTPLNSNCISEFTAFWKQYYDETMSKIKQDLNGFKAALEKLNTSCVNQEVVYPWIKSVKMMFNSTGGFNESNVDKNNMGNDKQCPKDALKRTNAQGVPEPHIVLSKMAKIFKEFQKPSSTDCVLNPLESNLMQCAYRLIAERLSKPTQAIQDQDMKEEMKAKAALTLKKKMIEVLVKNGTKPDEALKKVQARLAQCNDDGDDGKPRQLQIAPTFFKVTSAGVMKAEFSPFRTDKPYCWKRIARLRCPDCEKRMYGSATDRSKIYKCDA